MKNKFPAKIAKAIENKYELYWTRRWHSTLELRAVTYTYENGNFISRKLAEYDIKHEIEKIIQMHRLLCQSVEWAHLQPNLIKALDGAYYDGVLQKPIEVLLDQYEQEMREKALGAAYVAQQLNGGHA